MPRAGAAEKRQELHETGGCGCHLQKFEHFVHSCPIQFCTPFAIDHANTRQELFGKKTLRPTTKPVYIWPLTDRRLEDRVCKLCQQIREIQLRIGSAVIKSVKLSIRGSKIAHYTNLTVTDVHATIIYYSV
jgi:hypothetical protein